MPGLAGLDVGTLFRNCGYFSPLGLAVSGGADSLALMILAHEWATPRGHKLFVYSVDHGLRPEAADEVAFVMREAGRLGLSARALRWDGPHPTTGLQAAARQARYRLIYEAMRKDNCTHLLTAHHLHDQAETVLMRLAHGSGVEGLAGMRDIAVVERCEIIRPLLNVDPALLREVVREAGLRPIEDPSNVDDRYERVRWRRMLPELAALGLTPQRLATFAGRMADQNDVINQYIRDVLERPQGHEIEDGIVQVPRGDFDRLPKAVAVSFLMAGLRRVKGGGSSPSLSRLEEIWLEMRAERLGRVTIHGCILTSNDKTVSISREGPRRSAPKTRKTATAD